MLLSETRLGGMTVPNRVVMAPMTRSRASQPGDLPNALMARYYAQRATAGLIVSEGTPVSPVARGYSLTPGIFTDGQVEGWRLTTSAVHAAGGRIFAQIWHVGRKSNTVIAGQTPVAPSAVKVDDKVWGPRPDGRLGYVETDRPREMTAADVRNTIADFAAAARNAVDAGFDGVEIHGAHGYLLDQFLRMDCNRRSDRYGGNAQNRGRFAMELAGAVADEVGADKVGIRFSPYVSDASSGQDTEKPGLTLDLARQLSGLGIAYFHLSENIGNYEPVPDAFRRTLRERFDGTIIVAGKYTGESAQAALQSGLADMVAFGIPYITNPDLVRRLRDGLPLAPFDDRAKATLFGGGEEGYTDYPDAS